MRNNGDQAMGQVLPTEKCLANPDKKGNSERAEPIDHMFQAFCDRTRLRILNLLRENEMCVGDIVATLEVPQPRVSRHLGHLKKAGLVKSRRTGLWVHYRLAPPQSEFHRKLLDCAVTCFQEVPEIQSDIARAAQLKKSGGCCP